MKGDFSRFTHNPKKHYTEVLKQQGRVDLDADWNEQAEIWEHLKRTSNRDAIGLCGVPRDGGGFNIIMDVAEFCDIQYVKGNRIWAVGSFSMILSAKADEKNWVRQKPPAGMIQSLNAVYFIDASHGWIVGGNGIILATTDGGMKWTEQMSGTIESLNGVYFTDESHGWAVGGNGTILVTTNGGMKWTVQMSGTTESLNGVYFADVSHGWIAGANGTILVTTNGGMKWTVLMSGTTESLNSIYFADVSYGWAVGRNGTILATTNGGKIWTNQTVVSEPLNDIYFSGKYHGWIVGGNGKILATANGGMEWKEQASGTTEPLNGVYFADKSRGWAVGGNSTIIFTTDGGKKWEIEDLADYIARSFTISRGRIYVDGILTELDQDAIYWNQPDYPAPRSLEDLKIRDKESRNDIVFLDVWRRHITAIEDPEIKEIALGGPDTATRVKTVGQIKILENIEIDDCSSDNWMGRFERTSGWLTTRVVPSQDPKGPCDLSQFGGYLGLQNRLYRVEIHKGGKMGEAVFKWSRDNGSVVYPITIEGENRISLKHMGKDQILALHKGDWVEVLDDKTELSMEAGMMARIEQISDLKITLDVDNLDASDENMHPRIRRWDKDQKGDAIVVITNNPIILEDGIQVQFSGDHFRTGDYWTFKARTATGKVDELIDEPPMGVDHHYCRLALIKWRIDHESKKPSMEIIDCRHIFPPLTEMVSMFYVGGDGQEAMPNQSLPKPLQVGVANGGVKVAGASVKFSLEDSGSSGDVLFNVDEKTGTDGIARCWWKLGSSAPGRVIATLRDERGEPIGLPVYFNANLSIASDISFDPIKCKNMTGVNNVQDAIDNLCRNIGNDPAIYVGKISLLSTERELHNEDDVFVEDLKKGINIFCEFDDPNEILDIKIVSRASFFLTVDMPFPLGGVSPYYSKEAFMGDPIGFQPLILNSQVRAQGATLTWNPIDETIPFLNRLLDMIYEYDFGRSLLARLTLKGNFIWSGDEYKRYYLDGDAFGKPANGSPIALVLPSGDGKRGGDFQMWFWITRKFNISIDFPETVILGESPSQEVSGKVVMSIPSSNSGLVVNLSSEKPEVAELLTPSVIIQKGEKEVEFKILVKGGNKKGISVKITAVLEKLNKVTAFAVTKAKQ